MGYPPALFTETIMDQVGYVCGCVSSLESYPKKL